MSGSGCILLSPKASTNVPKGAKESIAEFEAQTPVPIQVHELYEQEGELSQQLRRRHNPD